MSRNYAVFSLIVLPPSSNQKDLLALVHNSGGMTIIILYCSPPPFFTVYSQSLTHTLQVVATPLMKTMERELETNTKTIQELKLKKEKLLETLKELDSSSVKAL